MKVGWLSTLGVWGPLSLVVGTRVERSYEDWGELGEGWGGGGGGGGGVLACGFCE